MLVYNNELESSPVFTCIGRVYFACESFISPKFKRSHCNFCKCFIEFEKAHFPWL